MICGWIVWWSSSGRDELESKRRRRGFYSLRFRTTRSLTSGNAEWCTYRSIIVFNRQFVSVVTKVESIQLHIPTKINNSALCLARPVTFSTEQGTTCKDTRRDAISHTLRLVAPRSAMWFHGWNHFTFGRNMQHSRLVHVKTNKKKIALLEQEKSIVRVSFCFVFMRGNRNCTDCKSLSFVPSKMSHK